MLERNYDVNGNCVVSSLTLNIIDNKNIKYEEAINEILIRMREYYHVSC